MKIKFGTKKNDKGNEGQIQNQTKQNDTQDCPINDQRIENNNQSESIRHVIKLDNSESGDNQQTKHSGDTVPNVEKKEQSSKKQENIEEPLKKQIEEKKEYLKQIKEFDFRISENQKQIEEFSKQINTVNENLDDLVSLYEIVSEQMNPFVGLSSVTKKRIEALENYSKDIEILKTRMMEIESDIDQFTNKSSTNFNKYANKSTIIPQTQSVSKPIEQGVSISKTNVEIPKTMETDIEKSFKCDWEKDMSDDELELIIERTLDDISVDHEIEQKLMQLLDKDQ